MQLHLGSAPCELRGVPHGKDISCALLTRRRPRKFSVEKITPSQPAEGYPCQVKFITVLSARKNDSRGGAAHYLRSSSAILSGRGLCGGCSASAGSRLPQWKQHVAWRWGSTQGTRHRQAGGRGTGDFSMNADVLVNFIHNHEVGQLPGERDEAGPYSACVPHLARGVRVCTSLHITLHSCVNHGERTARSGLPRPMSLGPA